MLTVSFIGLGNRGSVYAQYFYKNQKVKMIAACDIIPARVQKFHDEYGVLEENMFYDENEFFKQKRSDVLVISTIDRMHLQHALKGLELGYDLLLEKPVAPNLKDTEEIIRTAERLGREVVICHNLRYTPFYQGIKKLVVDGVIGDVLSFEQAENVGYFHYLTSFVRGNWHKSAESSSIILQKCCHDLDIIYWIIGKECKKLSSFGGLRHYCEDGAPKGSAPMCVDCKVENCSLNAIDLYTKYPGMLNRPYGFDRSPENVKRYLSDDSHCYGKCAYHLDNDVCDRQTVSMRFEDGVTATLIMQGFAATTTDRTTAVYGSKGMIEGKFNEGKITVKIIGKEPYVIDFNENIVDKESHNGGDAKLVDDYIKYKLGEEKPLGVSLAIDSLYSHRLAFSAEESRLLGGKPVSVEKDI